MSEIHKHVTTGAFVVLVLATIILAFRLDSELAAERVAERADRTLDRAERTATRTDLITEHTVERQDRADRMKGYADCRANAEESYSTAWARACVKQAGSEAADHSCSLHDGSGIQLNRERTEMLAECGHVVELSK